MKKLYNIKDCENFSISKIKKIYKNNVSNSIVSLFESFSFGNELIKSAEGQYIYTKDGKKILDLTAGLGVLNLGHNNDNVLNNRINFQKEKKMEVYKNFLSPYIAGLSHNISQLLPSKLNYSFFCNSGAEAIDGSIKIAYKYYNGKRKYILHSDRSFHGKLLGSLSISNSNKQFQFPKIPNTKPFKFNDINDLKYLIKKLVKDNNESDIYAIVIEPFSASSMESCSPEFLKFAREVCDDYNIVLIFDEIYTGFYKTGKLFHFLRYNLSPDILVLSKSLGGGKSSISGYVSKDKIALNSYDNINDALLHSTTYNGFGEECITAITAINEMVEGNFEKKSQDLSMYLDKKLNTLKNSNKKILNIKGEGCIRGIIFNIDIPILKISKFLPSYFLKDKLFIKKLVVVSIMEELYKKYNILTTFKDNINVTLCVEPSLVTTKDNIDHFIKSLDSILKNNIYTLVLNLIKNKIMNNYLFLK